MFELLISSFNCNGLAEKKKRGDVFMWLADKNYDIFCLQETHSTQLDEIKWKGEWGVRFTFLMGAPAQEV